MSTQLILTLLTLLFVIIGFFSGKFKLGTIAMTASIFLCVTGVLKFDETFAYFSNKNMVMVVAMFILGYSLTKTHFVIKLREWILNHAGSGTKLVGMYLIACAVLVQILLPTPLISVMIPFMEALDPHSEVQPTNLLFPGASLAHMAQNAIPLGVGLTMFSQINMYLQSGGSSETVGMFSTIKAAIIPLIVGWVFLTFIGWKLFPKQKVDDTKVVKAQKIDESKFVSPKNEKIIYVTFIVVMMAIIFAKYLPFDSFLAPIIGVLFLIYMKIMTVQDVKASLNIDTIFMLGGILPLATAMQNTGAGEWVSGLVTSALGGSPSPVVLFIVVYLTVAILTQFMSNSATQAIFSPLAVMIAVNNGYNAVPFVIGVAIAATAAMCTPMASPSCAVAYGAGNYKMGDIFKAMIPCWLLYSAAAIVSILIFYPLK